MARAALPAAERAEQEQRHEEVLNQAAPARAQDFPTPAEWAATMPYLERDRLRHGYAALGLPRPSYTTPAPLVCRYL